MVWFLVTALIAGITRRMDAGFFVAGMGAAWLLRIGAPRRQAFALAVLAVACVVYGAAFMRDLERGRDIFSATFAAQAQVEMVGCVASFPRTGVHGTTFRFRSERPTALSMEMRASRFDVHAGDRVRVRARAVDTRRAPRSLFADGCVGVVRVSAGDMRVITTSARAHTPLTWRLHRYVRVTLERRLGKRAALPLALLLGERGLVPAATRAAFATLGISHLLALSGMHLALIAVWVWALLRAARLPPRHCQWVAAIVLGLYVAVVGEIHSLSRALLMAWLVVAARTIQRPVDGTAVLSRALFVLLLARPSSLYSVGFQLSFVATLAVVLALKCSPRIDRRGRLRRFLAGAATTVLAGLSVLVVAVPLQTGYFGAVGVLGPLATLVFMPGVAAILGGSVLAVALNRVPLAGDAVFAALGGCAQLVDVVSLSLAARMGGPPALHPPHALVYTAGLTLAVTGRRRPAVVVAGVAMMAAAFAKTCGI